MFESAYRLTDPQPGLSSAFSLFAAELPTVPAVGVYNDGLFSVVDTDRSKSLLREWTKLLGRNSVAFLSTGFGDLFCWEARLGFYYLDVQRAKVDQIHDEAIVFAGEYMTFPGVRENVFRELDLLALIGSLGVLKYKSVFIPEPWPMLGGSGALSTYTKGECDTYLDLLGQTHAR